MAESERELYESGLSLGIVAQLVGLKSPEAVRQRILKQGGTMRPKGTNV